MGRHRAPARRRSTSRRRGAPAGGRVRLAIPAAARSGPRSSSRSSPLVVLMLWWRGPDWNVVYHAFDLVNWAWVALAVVLNLFSVLAAVARLAADDRAGARPARSAVQPDVLRLLGRTARKRCAPRADRRARARGGAAAAPAARPRDERGARGHRLHAPSVRPLPGPAPDRLRPRDGEDPALGGDEPARRRRARARAADGGDDQRAAADTGRRSRAPTRCAVCSGWRGRGSRC